MRVIPAISIALILFTAGCTSTGTVISQEVQENQPQTQPVFDETPTGTPVKPTQNECNENIQCPEGKSCLDNQCVGIQFVK